MVNKIILIGNVGQEPNTRKIGENTVANFSLATTSPFKDKDGNKQTTWHNVQVWGKLAEITEQYVHKGDRLFIEGRMQYRTYEDKENIKRTIAEVVAENLTMLGGAAAKNESQQANQHPVGSEQNPLEVDSLDILPF